MWTIEVDIGRAKDENEFDAIIIGGGIGGLTCGAILANRGYKILVLERSHSVGGYCTSFRRNGFIFNSGPNDISSLWEGGTLYNLLQELGIEKDGIFSASKKRIIVEGNIIDIPDSLEELIVLLSKLFPEDAQNIRAFFKYAQSAYDELCSDIKTYGSPLTFGWAKQLVDEMDFGLYIKEHSNLMRWFRPTYLEIIKKYLKNEAIIKILFAFDSYTGTTIENTPGMIGLSIYFSCFAKKSHAVKGGAGIFAEKLREVIEKNGSKVLTRSKVDKIEVKEGRVTGVVSNDMNYKSEIVVSNANVKNTFSEFIDLQHTKLEYRTYVQGLKMSPSYFVLYLGVDMDLSNLPDVIIDTEQHLDLYINAKKEMDMAPKNCSSLTILLIENTDYYELPERNSSDYRSLKNQIAEIILERTEKLIPGIKKHILVKEVASPRTFERYTSIPEGAWYSFDQSINTVRPFSKTELKGLYLVGASVLPGCGVEGAATSGILCAKDICRNVSYKSNCGGIT